MLVLTGQEGERVLITHKGEHLWLQFMFDHRNRRVRVGYEGPHGFVIAREKLLKRKSPQSRLVGALADAHRARIGHSSGIHRACDAEKGVPNVDTH